MSFIRREDFPVALGAGAIAVSVLSGKLDLGGELLSVRLYALLAAVVFLWPELRRVAVPALGWVLFAFLAYMITRSFFDAGPLTAAKQIDALYLGAQIVLVSAAARTGLRYLVAAVLAIASAYLVVAVVGQIFPDIGSDSKYGLGWGPVGTAITFSRIEFLGFCMAAILIPLSPAAIGLAALFLYATFSSLMKSALVASVIALGFLLGTLGLGRRWRNAVTICAVTVVAFVAFQHTFAPAALNRIERVFPSAGEGGGAISAAPGQNVDAANGRFVITTEYCLAGVGGAADCKRGMFVDASQRLILLAEAMSGFFRRPIVGNGMGNYGIVAIHPSYQTRDPYVYPHNLAAEVAFEGGLLGLAGLAAAVLVLVYSLAISPAPLLAKAGVGTFVTFMAAAALFGGDLYDSRIAWLVAIALLARWPALAGDRLEFASLGSWMETLRRGPMRRLSPHEQALRTSGDADRP